MLFTSFDFAVFMLTVFVIYWFASKGSYNLQNIVLLIASYYFYSLWDWRFLLLLIASTIIGYCTGYMIYRAKTHAGRKSWLMLSIVLNCFLLFIFKYYNFILTTLLNLLNVFHITFKITITDTLLPIGISFYTFHNLSYVFDIYNRKRSPTKNLINYSLFVTFFPLLVAGPIERATHLLPQIERARLFHYEDAVHGLRQILWGLFKKIVIADNCAQYVNQAFNAPEDYSGSDLVLGSVFFATQIYGDFSGYSDIALGTARLLGFELLRNFSYPYFSRDIAEFWRRWHISLSSWFKDYLYIPLGGSKGGRWLKIRNVFIIFILSGFWHGANWKFIVWGAINAVYFLPLLLLNKNRNNLEVVAKGKLLPSINELIHILLTFSMTCFAWIFFRADTFWDAIRYISGFCSLSLFTLPLLGPGDLKLLILAFIIIEWIGREQPYAIAELGTKWPLLLRWSIYYILIIFIVINYGKNKAFIYFQF